MKTLLTLIEKPGHVCYRYRAQAFEPWLREAGWRLEAIPVPRGMMAFVRLMSDVAKADAVMLQRRLLSWWQIRLLRRSAKMLLFDIDDAVFFRDNNSVRGHESRRRFARFAAAVQRADAVLSGNDFLVERANAAGAKRAIRFPTCVDPSRYRPQPSERRDGGIHLVWIGSQSTMTSLSEIQPGLAEATRQLPGLKLRVICDAFPKLAGVEVEPIVWSEATESAEIAGADIGISHLPEHPWSRGKCGLKVLQYMAAGLPVVANPYGVHQAMIQSDAGVVASTPQEWAAAIVKLATDPHLRQRMGLAGRRRLEADYSVDQWGPRLVEILRRSEFG